MVACTFPCDLWTPFFAVFAESRGVSEMLSHTSVSGRSKRERERVRKNDRQRRAHFNSLRHMPMLFATIRSTIGFFLGGEENVGGNYACRERPRGFPSLVRFIPSEAAPFRTDEIVLSYPTFRKTPARCTTPPFGNPSLPSWPTTHDRSRSQSHSTYMDTIVILGATDENMEPRHDNTERHPVFVFVSPETRQDPQLGRLCCTAPSLWRRIDSNAATLSGASCCFQPSQRAPTPSAHPNTVSNRRRDSHYLIRVFPRLKQHGHTPPVPPPGARVVA